MAHPMARPMAAFDLLEVHRVRVELKFSTSNTVLVDERPSVHVCLYFAAENGALCVTICLTTLTLRLFAVN